MSFLFSVFANTSIRGSDAIATTQAYIVISRPALDSLMAKSFAISDNSPIGTNSEVLNTKAANVSDITGIHAAGPFLTFFSEI